MRRVYGICGFMGSGKNTVANALIECHHAPYRTHSFAAPLKDGVAAFFGWDRELLEGDSERSRQWRETPDPFWSEAFGRPFTPRTALQEVGTNLFRSWLTDFWVMSVAQRTQGDGLHIITDARFANEMRWIATTDGLVMWVYRPDVGQLNAHDRANLAHLVRRAAPLGVEPITFTTPLHPSETSFLTEGAEFIDVVIENRGDMQELRQLAAHVNDVWSLQIHDAEHACPVPLQTTTCYVSYGQREFIWRWTDEGGHQTHTYAIMNTPHTHTRGREGQTDADV